MEKVRKHILFSGRVQGVGFRYRAMYLCQTYSLTGWVGNLWDGRVEMEIQGEERSIYDMIGALNTGSFIRIDDYVVKDLPVDVTEHRFEVR